MNHKQNGSRNCVCIQDGCLLVGVEVVVPLTSVVGWPNCAASVRRCKSGMKAVVEAKVGGRSGLAPPGLLMIPAAGCPLGCAAASCPGPAPSAALGVGGTLGLSLFQALKPSATHHPPAAPAMSQNRISPHGIPLVNIHSMPAIFIAE
jgi:hypothetical protein